jgi:hypothetical protein
MEKTISKVDKHKKIKVSKNIIIDNDTDNDVINDIDINTKKLNQKYKSIYNKSTKIVDSDSDFESCTESEKDEEKDEEQDEDYDNLEKELENKYKKNYPKNYGSKWSEKDKNKLLEQLINCKYIIYFDSDDVMINKLAIKLKRSIGGIKAEIRRVVFEQYMEGIDAEAISKKFNIIFRDVKQIIRLHLEKESENEINLLEKENKLLKLRIENAKLRDELKNIQKIK